jgi:hypothetical protein
LPQSALGAVLRQEKACSCRKGVSFIRYLVHLSGFVCLNSMDCFVLAALAPRKDGREGLPQPSLRVVPRKDGSEWIVSICAGCGASPRKSLVMPERR